MRGFDSVWKNSALLLALILTACRRDMADQAHHEPLESSNFFPNHAASRPLPAHTIPRGELRADAHFYTGRVGGQLVTTLPAPVTRAQLERGRERFDIFCAVCHGRTGAGNGMISQRGFPPRPRCISIAFAMLQSGTFTKSSPVATA